MTKVSQLTLEELSLGSLMFEAILSQVLQDFFQALKHFWKTSSENYHINKVDQAGVEDEVTLAHKSSETASY